MVNNDNDDNDAGRRSIGILYKLNYEPLAQVS